VDLAGFAAALRQAQEAIADHGATDCADGAARAFLAQFQENTPVLTGALRDSERVNGVSGSGTQATASISTHLPLYASFRNDGGTIRAHDRPRGGWTGSPTGTFPRRWGVHQHTLHWPGGGFPLEVTQEGSRYLERTADWAEGGGLDAPCTEAIEKILHDSGL
jgi:hypothetical protein